MSRYASTKYPIGISNAFDIFLIVESVGFPEEKIRYIPGGLIPSSKANQVIVLP
jgi:hypothetical protein